MDASHESRGRRSKWVRLHVTWAAVVAGWYALLVVAAWTTEKPAGACSGIGWGCTLWGRDLAELVALMAVLPAAIVVLVGSALIEAARGVAPTCAARRVGVDPYLAADPTPR